MKVLASRFVAVFSLAAIIGAAGAVLLGAPASGEPQDEQVVGPGRVHLTFTRDGRWLDFTPAWNDGQVLFSTGGLFVFAKGSDGRLTEILNTTTDQIRVSENASKIRTCHEGAEGGSRAPSEHPDDDRDGRMDEDQLDGVDNDGDGRVDEDFAAIGDEMTATCYFSPVIEGSRAHLAVRQESYAWALPHIDGTVMMGLWIKNVGSEALEDVHIGALFEKEGPFYFSNWVVSLPGEREAEHASVTVCEDLQGTTAGLVIFPENGIDGGSWAGGVIEDPRDAGASILGRLSNAPRGGFPGEVDSPFTASPSDASVFKSKETRLDGRVLVYRASPNLGVLRPGDEINVDLAFFAVREKTEVETAAINAFKTFAGDRTVHYLPPPVSMTPRVLWGSYRPVENDAAGTPRVAVEFDAAGTDAVTAGEISYFSGVAPEDVEREDVEPGVQRLVLRGDFLQKALRKGERIILKGRLENGEFFEAILRPMEGALSPMAGPDGAAFFWQTEGRLEYDLLSSSPNPFRELTTISYEIPSLLEEPDGTRIETKESLEISVKVYNVMGRLVSVLVDEILPPGIYTTGWRAVDDQGNAVASGVYYVRLQIGKKFLTQRLILLK